MAGNQGWYATFDEFAASTHLLMGLALHLTQDHHRAEDVVAEVLGKVYFKWPRISSMNNPHAYVKKMIVNASNSFWSRASTRHELVDADIMGVQLGSVPDATEAYDNEDELRAAIRLLNKRQRTAIVLRFYSDLDYEEIAEIMRIRPGTARFHVSVGLEALRELLGKERNG